MAVGVESSVTLVADDGHSGCGNNDHRLCPRDYILAPDVETNIYAVAHGEHRRVASTAAELQTEQWSSQVAAARTALPWTA